MYAYAKLSDLCYPNLTILVLLIGLVTTWGYTCLIRIHQKLVRPDWHTPKPGPARLTYTKTWSTQIDTTPKPVSKAGPARLTRLAGTARHIVRFVKELFIVRFMKELYLSFTHSSSSMILFIVRFVRELYFSSTHKKTKNPNFHGTIHSMFNEGIIHSTFYEGIIHSTFYEGILKELFMIFFIVRFMRELFIVRFMKEFWRNYS